MTHTQKQGDKMETITIKQFDSGTGGVSSVEIDAHVFGPFSVHVTPTSSEDDSERFTITHTPTGYSIASGFDYSHHAIDGVSKILERLETKDIEKITGLSVETGQKNRLLKQVSKYLNAWKTICNNIPTEKMVGVFYQDRANAEKLLSKINPTKIFQVTDDNALKSKSHVTAIISGNYQL